MKKSKALWVVLLLFSASGCPDSPASLTHELLVFWNEVCDNTVRITDEKSATEVLKNLKGRLEIRYVDLKDRAGKRLLTIEKREQAVELEDALLDSFHEIDATEKRVKSCQERLEKLSKESSPNSNILAVLQWMKEKQDFNLPLGSTSYVANPRDPKAPKQFGHKMMLPWPQLERTPPPPDKNQDPPELELSRNRLLPLCLPAWKA